MSLEVSYKFWWPFLLHGLETPFIFLYGRAIYKAFKVQCTHYIVYNLFVPCGVFSQYIPDIATKVSHTVTVKPFDRPPFGRHLSLGGEIANCESM